ncbi:MAG: hypothetical protein Q8L85_00085 [Alphaproteobacteria bacterium]|nr:hypothetical protein [Alphaproteobacteria bacterium]
MKKTTLFVALLCTMLFTNSLQAMFNSNNKRINVEEQSDANNKRTKINDDDNSEKKQPVLRANAQEDLKSKEVHNTSKEVLKKLPILSSNVRLPQQQYQVFTFPQYNVNIHTTNNITLNIPAPTLSSTPHIPFLMQNNYTPEPQPNLLNINMDHVKQYLANNQHVTQNKQPTHQEKTNYSDTYIFDLKEIKELNKIYNEVIKPITAVTHVVFKILPSFEQTKFLSMKFPCTQKIDASALFGEGFSNIHLGLNKKEKIFYKFHDIVESIKEKSSKFYKNESLALIDIKRSVLNYILNAYLSEPQNPCNSINTLLHYEQLINQQLNNSTQNNPQYTNNNNDTTQILSQKSNVHTNLRQSTPPSQPKKPLPVLQKTNITNILKNFQQTPIQNIRSKSPFAENNNAHNSNTKEKIPLFDTNIFIDSILASPMPMDDFSDLTSETQSNLDFFYNNDTTDLTLVDANIMDKNPYTVQNDTIFVFDTNARKCLAQKIALPSETQINELCFRICPTDLEFFELSEFFYNVQKVDLSFVLNNNKSNIKSILQNLKTFEHLKELKLDGNQLTDETILWIANELPHLETLILDNNFISDKGAEAISQLYDLKELSINSNQLKDQGAINLAGMPNLVTFNYDNNQISEAGKKAIYAIRKEVMFLHNAD